jgi:four helix bundle protein
MNQQRTGQGWGNRERRQGNAAGDRGRGSAPPQRSGPQEQPRSRSDGRPSRGDGEGQGEQKRGFKDLIVWQRATELAVAVYGLSKQLPVEEDAALGGLLRCAATSVATSIAAGHARHDATAFAQRLLEARDHLSELETLMEIGLQVGCLREAAVDDVTPTMVSVRQLLQRLIQRVESQEQA